MEAFISNKLRLLPMKLAPSPNTILDVESLSVGLAATMIIHE